MSSLRHAAGNTHVEVNSGGAAVISRAVKAAVNPTEGQRMLQAGFQGAILGGESREKTSTTINADGIERVDRVLESSVVSENGQSVLVQSVQQSAQQLPPMPNIDMAANPEFAIWKTDVMSNMKHLLDLSTVTTKLWHKVDAVEKSSAVAPGQYECKGQNIPCHDTDKLEGDTGHQRRNQCHYQRA